MSIGSYVLKVTPEQLQSKAGEIDGQISKIETAFDGISSIIDSSTNYWQGEASDSYRSKYKSEKDDIAKMLKRVKEHVTDLNNIASNYTKAEAKNKDMSNQLPADVIV